MSAPFDSRFLSSGWTFKQGHRGSDSKYRSAQNVPTEVHLDLFSNREIPDPFNDLNELSSRWIADEAWTYRTSFNVDSYHETSNARTVLVFQGLDTFATVWLNETMILQSNNMFVEHRVDISEQVKQAGTNNNFILEIEFESARQKGLELIKEHSEHHFIVHQTEVGRGPVRKGQYHWGWDWGPILLGCGPWKPIRLENFEARIDDVWVEYELLDNLTQVAGEIFVKIEGQGKVIADLAPAESSEVLFQCRDFERISDGVFSAKFSLENVHLWWPRNYGQPFLYNAHVGLKSSEFPDEPGTIPLHQVSKSIGFRKVELVQEADNNGTSFYFRINDVDIFSGGSCWIPADSFLSRVTTGDYRAWIQKAAEGNQAMVRVWGGGIYESDAFYDAADELGVLIWQDFAFACASYPTFQSYLDSVATEARQNVRRLRNHPSLVIWAGNNEDYQIVERYNLDYDREDKDPQSWLKTDFPARYIYEHLLPQIVQEESKGVPYHPSSPFGNGTSTTLKVDPTVGDVHQWNVWHGTMEPYHRLPSMGGRFVSEFGMEAYPHIETLKKCITDDKNRYPGSMAMDFRNKAIGHERRLISYVAENFRIRYDLENFTHLTQLVQADALTWAYKSWRREWGVPGDRKNGGALVWQLNDCWPTMSWAVMDYFKIPKPGYYAIKRELRPITVNVQRKVNEWTVRPADALWHRDTSHIDMRKIWGEVEFDCWVASSQTKRIQGSVAVRYISVKSGEDVLESSSHEVEISENGTTEVIRGKRIAVMSEKDRDTPFQPSLADPFIIYATLKIDGVQVCCDVSWPDPVKYLSFPNRGVKVRYSDGENKAFVTAERPVKGFVFSEKTGMTLSDNGFDIVPGDTREVSATLQEGKIQDLKWRYVEMG
ncbi:unnamed protein product [Periconia digitata]|uniref:Beta-mannosidase B n=1 Tax=Periconia digitata TaxID=1303443 RepID=A0A9W4UD14_9PLEO|nr:unnamed protein product [Periconia digitata]